MYPSRKPFAFDLKKKLLSHLRKTKKITEAVQKADNGTERNKFIENLQGHVQKNQSTRDIRTFSQIKQALGVLLNTLKDSRNNIYISGGIVFLTLFPLLALIRYYIPF